MTARTEALKAVEAGAAFLDAKGVKNWRAKINLRTFDIGRVEDCVLGQIYGSYFTGRDDIFHIDVKEAGELGFNTHFYAQDMLNELWVELLSRPAPAPAPAPEPDVLVLDAQLVKLFAKRMKQMQDPTHTLESVEFNINGVLVKLQA